MTPPESAAGEKSGHLPVLDGLRGVAILFVLVDHYSALVPASGGLAGAVKYLLFWGRTGVDLFFVLSGFLITRILLSTLTQERYFLNFYSRRFLRIFPVYYGFLGLFFFLLGPNLLPGDPDFSWLRQHQVWFWCYASNVLQAVHGAMIPYLPHFWTLAIEEQFYLLWPLLLFLVGRTRYLPLLCVGLICLAPALRIGLLAAHVQGFVATTLLPSRCDGLAMGALLAYAEAGGKRMNLTGVAVVAVVVAVFCGVTLALPGTLAFLDLGRKGLYQSLEGLLFLILVALAVRSQSGERLFQMFNAKSLRTIGKYSYGMYVFHFPLLIFVHGDGFARHLSQRVGFLPAVILVTLSFSAVTFLLAYGSWHVFEKHFLRLKRYFEPRRPTAIAG